MEVAYVTTTLQAYKLGVQSGVMDGNFQKTSQKLFSRVLYFWWRI